MLITRFFFNYIFLHNHIHLFMKSSEKKKDILKEDLNFIVMNTLNVKLFNICVFD